MPCEFCPADGDESKCPRCRHDLPDHDPTEGPSAARPQAANPPTGRAVGCAVIVLGWVAAWTLIVAVGLVVWAAVASAAR